MDAASYNMYLTGGGPKGCQGKPSRISILKTFREDSNEDVGMIVFISSSTAASSLPILSGSSLVFILSKQRHLERHSPLSLMVAEWTAAFFRVLCELWLHLGLPVLTLFIQSRKTREYCVLTHYEVFLSCCVNIMSSSINTDFLCVSFQFM